MDNLIYILIVIAFVYFFYIKGFRKYVKSVSFWKEAQRNKPKATEYFRNSPNWKIEIENYGSLKGWYGPYRFPAYEKMFYVYCISSDVSNYLNELKDYRGA